MSRTDVRGVYSATIAVFLAGGCGGPTEEMHPTEVREQSSTRDMPRNSGTQGTGAATDEVKLPTVGDEGSLSSDGTIEGSTDKVVPPVTGGRLFADLRDIRKDIRQRTYALLPATEWVVMEFLAEADDRWWAGVYWLYDDDGKALGKLTIRTDVFGQAFTWTDTEETVLSEIYEATEHQFVPAEEGLLLFRYGIRSGSMLVGETLMSGHGASQVVDYFAIGAPWPRVARKIQRTRAAPGDSESTTSVTWYRVAADGSETVLFVESPDDKT